MGSHVSLGCTTYECILDQTHLQVTINDLWVQLKTAEDHKTLINHCTVLSIKINVWRKSGKVVGRMSFATLGVDFGAQ